MKKMKRLLASLLAVSCVAGACAGLVGCDGDKDKSESSATSEPTSETTATGEYDWETDIGGEERGKITLRISTVNAGYGLDWLQPALDAFKNLDWVKEKYPRLVIAEPNVSNLENLLADLVSTEKKYDLYMAVGTLNQQLEKMAGNDYAVKDLTDLYNSVVPCEDVTMAQKMNKHHIKEYMQERDGEEYMSAVPWNSGSQGMIYNETRLKYLRTKNPDISAQLPVTSNELVTMLGELGEAMTPNTTDKPFVWPGRTRYFNIIEQWWAQYEGVDGYRNYWNLVDEYGDPNVSIFSQQGRLYGLKTTEDIIGYTTGNAYVVPNTTDLANMQNRFCMGAQGVFTVNGDWFYNESAKSTASTGNVIRWLRAPVTSYIVNKCSQVKDDTKLAFVIRAIDAEKDFAATAAEYATAGHGTLLEADYNIIKEARLVGGRGGGHCSYVCNGSDAEYVAMDFLRFLATDQGNKIVMDSTAGMVTPYIGGESTNYQVPEEDLETYAPFLQDRILEQQKVVVMPASESFKSVYKGSLYPWTTTVYPEIAFGASNPDDRKTAQQIYEEDIAYYTANENAFFETLKAQTGI